MSNKLEATGLPEYLAELEATIARVRALADEWWDMPDWAELAASNAAIELREALDDECPHDSFTGVDQTNLSDPAKVWRCDHCGYKRVGPR